MAFLLFPYVPQVEGPQRGAAVLGRERHVLVMQTEALRTEAQQAERDLEEQCSRHQQELHSLRDESLQVGILWVHMEKIDVYHHSPCSAVVMQSPYKH